MNPSPLSPPLPDFGNKISPSILLIIVILAVIFFLSTLLHLLVRYLLRPSSSAPTTAVQGQLRHLFHLHDAGVDQSSIDALPVFLYQSLAGRSRENPFDCAVCLSEFQPADELRLLPGCSHAFHLPCIDTWLLAHSTCPLCRRSLIPDVLDSEIGLDFGDSRRNQNLGFVERDDNFIPNSIIDDPKEESEAVDSKLVRVKLGTFNNSDAAEIGGEVVGTSLNINSNSNINLDQRRCFSMGCYEYVMDEASTKNPPSSKKNTKEKYEAVDSIVVQVKLGTFRNLDATEIGGEGTSDSNINFDQRRCFSMGSYEYVMDDASILRVAIEPLSAKMKQKLAMSECDCHSKREGFNSFDPPPLPPPSPLTTSSFGAKLQQRESFSFSKIWLRTSKENPKSGDSSRRLAGGFVPASIGA